MSSALPAMTIGLRARFERGPRRHRHVLGLQRRARTALRHRSRIDARSAVEPRRLQGWIRLAGAGDGARTCWRQLRSGRLRPARRAAPAGPSGTAPAAGGDAGRCGFAAAEFAPVRVAPAGPAMEARLSVAGRRSWADLAAHRAWAADAAVRVGRRPAAIRRRSRPACTRLRRALHQLRPKRAGVLHKGRRRAGRLRRRCGGSLRRPGDAGRRRTAATLAAGRLIG